MMSNVDNNMHSDNYFLKRKSNKSKSANNGSTSRKHPQRIFGLLRGKIMMAKDFDSIPEDFEGYV